MNSPIKFRENRCDVNPPRIMSEWEECIICLDDAVAMAAGYFQPEDWGAPIAASCWTSKEGRIRMFCADYANGRRLYARHSKRGWKVTFTTTPVAAS